MKLHAAHAHAQIRGQSLLARGVWIEILGRVPGGVQVESLLARGVWIEITWCYANQATVAVAPRKGSVD